MVRTPAYPATSWSIAPACCGTVAGASWRVGMRGLPRTARPGRARPPPVLAAHRAHQFTKPHEAGTGSVLAVAPARPYGRSRGHEPEVTGMKGYGQFCPIAKTMEVLDERWTVLIVREMLAGS